MHTAETPFRHHEVPDDRLFVNAREAAGILGMDERTVGSAIRAGQIPAFKVGVFWRIPTAWLRKQAGMGDRDAAS
jgi:excisionase family DNA binding protein